MRTAMLIASSGVGPVSVMAIGFIGVVGIAVLTTSSRRRQHDGSTA